MNRISTYDKFPSVAVPGFEGACCVGWAAIGAELRRAVGECGAKTVVIETYPGVLDAEVLPHLRRELPTARFVESAAALKSSEAIDAMVVAELTDDPVFGRMTRLELADFFDRRKLEELRSGVAGASGLTVVYGVGASLVSRGDLVVYLDMPRWEIQARQRRKEIANLGADNVSAGAWAKYKRAFFIDWRVADRHKRDVWEAISYFIDTTVVATPKMASAAAVRAGLKACLGRPFRVVPFFDPGVWGGQWMKEVCDLPREKPNYAWCFDCVPEENSLLLRFGEQCMELPGINLVHQHPQELMGEAVLGRFGAEFPIRFDFLDTMGGGNLSLQVHPLTEYIREHFGMGYTQDESYYMLEAADDACVYLGMKTGSDPEEFAAALQAAQRDAGKPLEEEKFVNQWPAKKHDHFLIPAGTIHCSGRNSMVLEISATPYIFTFKLWDWSRVDLDGKPRPISLAHGKKNLVHSRDTEWTKANLINQFSSVAKGDGWREERTGLHEAEFIETRRHWFTGAVPHHTGGGVNVLNLVEGEEVTVTSPTGAFEPFVVHYAETFIVPAVVGEYMISPSGASVGKECATMKAFVRTRP